jgi:hypothetical protein
VAQSDMQCAACTTFVKILRDNLVPVPKYVETFLQSILSSIDHKDSGNTAYHVSLKYPHCIIAWTVVRVV